VIKAYLEVAIECRVSDEAHMGLESRLWMELKGFYKKKNVKTCFEVFIDVIGQCIGCLEVVIECLEETNCFFF